MLVLCCGRILLVGAGIREFSTAAGVVRRQQLAYVGRPVLQRRLRSVLQRSLQHLLPSLSQSLPVEPPARRARARPGRHVYVRQPDYARAQRQRAAGCAIARAVVDHIFAGGLCQRTGSATVRLHLARE